MFIDESGCTGQLLTKGNTPVQPVLVIAGIIIAAHELPFLTGELLRLKRRFYPAHFAAQPHQLDAILHELKGSLLRAAIAQGSAKERVHAIGLLDNIIGLLQGSNSLLLARVLVKGIGVPIDRTAVYTAAVQSLTSHFQTFLEVRQSNGLIVADSRTYYQNWPVSHSIFTQKFRSAGDRLDRLTEIPVFGHSLNHCGLQLCDLVCSALIAPIAINSFCVGHIQSVHVKPGFARIKTRYSAAIRAMQFRYQLSATRWTGGITVNDQLSHRSGASFF